MSQFILIPQEKFEHLVHKIDELFVLLYQKNELPLKIEDWVPEAYAQKLLGLKKTSLWALRKKGKIIYSKIGSKIFYSRSSIEKMLNKNQM